MGRLELGMAISQAVLEVEKEKLEMEKEKLGVEKEKLGVEKEKLGVEKEKEKMEKELRVEKAEMEKELRLELSNLRGAVKDKETVILRLHGKLSLRGAIGGWLVGVLMSVVASSILLLLPPPPLAMDDDIGCVGLQGDAAAVALPRTWLAAPTHHTNTNTSNTTNTNTHTHRGVPEGEGAACAWPQREGSHQRGGLEPVPGPQAGRAGAHRAPNVVAG